MFSTLDKTEGEIVLRMYKWKMRNTSPKVELERLFGTFSKLIVFPNLKTSTELIAICLPPRQQSNTVVNIKRNEITSTFSTCVRIHRNFGAQKVRNHDKFNKPTLSTNNENFAGNKVRFTCFCTRGQQRSASESREAYWLPESFQCYLGLEWRYY